MQSNSCDWIQILTLFIAFASSCAAWRSAYFSYKIAKVTQKEKLDRDLDDLLKINLQYPNFELKQFTYKWKRNKADIENLKYPNFELKQFTSKWDRNTADIEYLRYDVYCNLIYNYISRIFEFYNGDKKKVEEFVDVRSWIRNHKENWNNPIELYENVEGYSEDFRKFINSYFN